MARARFEDHYPELWTLAYNVAFRMTGSRHVAEDIAQGSMERAFRSWRTVHGHCEPWVVRVATNLVLSEKRHDKVVDRTGAAEANLPAAAPKAPGHIDERTALRTALAALSERQRSVVVLRHLYGYSVAETAAALGISDGSVKTHAHRGLANLRATLHGEARSLIGEDDDPCA